MENLKANEERRDLYISLFLNFVIKDMPTEHLGDIVYALRKKL